MMISQFEIAYKRNNERIMPIEFQFLNQCDRHCRSTEKMICTLKCVSKLIDCKFDTKAHTNSRR